MPASRVVAEDPGRKKPGGGKRESTQRSPDDVLRAGGAAEGGAQRRVRSRGGVGVEESEVAVLLGRLDEAGAETRLAQDRFEILGEQVAREIELARPKSGCDGGGRKSRLELDPIDARWL